MQKCKDCNNYDDSSSYPNTGYCELYELYVAENNEGCEDWEEQK